MRGFLIIAACLVITVCSKDLRSAEEIHYDISNDDSEERIVGGTLAVNHSRPWMIYLFSTPPKSSCGGALIQSQWVLTAAHCVDGGLTYTAVAGTNQRRVVRKNTVQSGFGVDAELRNATSIYLHDLYNRTARLSDIALLKLDKPFTINQNIKTIPFSTKDFKQGDMLEMSGWGRTSAASRRNETLLRTVSLPVASKQECHQAFPFPKADQICAGYEDGRKASCKGDSGGPLVDLSGNAATLVGIFSYGKEQCNSFDIYSSVKFYKNWIENTIKK